MGYGTKQMIIIDKGGV